VPQKCFDIINKLGRILYNIKIGKNCVRGFKNMTEKHFKAIILFLIFLIVSGCSSVMPFLTGEPQSIETKFKSD
jgi:hypothetical protein